ncbi:acetyl-CoA carboxylase biotin carboxyl carrier protein subunit [Oceanobacillus piezotolerans]|uniref:Acetyl-CoA carboxylase biotin carboxyl carrier protein subunit n=1 Tax=Oceanobacillus piezotolerans TaxID=2448030 RepID=A0A498DBM1_9BACI|nr:acetyl-CoA carboxylase biotin carboxyl carrier protein subunit [Oceanobacillus piezotolerans]RLL45430.1 acetyl-CoA carboxylase biotin carboxyl carrier protein subunit [Oceanobacillus piezotolerans]
MHEVRATMAGSVWRVEVKVGDTVEIDQEVVVIESMKMEIPILTEKAGRIKALHVAAGDFIDEGDLLVTIE